MTTARTIIKKALQKIGALTKSEEPSADEASDGLDALNYLLSSWANDSLLIYTKTRESFPVTPGTGSYTIGPTGDFVTTRPIFIADAFLTSNQIDYPLSIISDDLYSQIADKSVGGIPIYLNYDNNYANGTIKLYPVPTNSYTLNLYSEKPLTTMTLDSDITLPPGWERMMIYNLAVELLPEYEQPVDQSVYSLATASMADVKRAVSRVRSMDVNPSNTFSMFSRYLGFR